jgi:hypothetical protein
VIVTAAIEITSPNNLTGFIDGTAVNQVPSCPTWDERIERISRIITNEIAPSHDVTVLVHIEWVRNPNGTQTKIIR